MAFLKKIKFGQNSNDIAKTIVNGAPEGVIKVTNTEGYDNLDTEDKDYSYDIDVNVDESTIVKSEGKLAVGTVPAEKVSVAASAGLTSSDAQAAFKELKDKIDEVEGAAKSYTIVKKTEGLATNVKEQYQLQDESNTPVGEPINIYKDSSLKSVELKGQALEFTYILDTGAESVVSVDVSTFLAESEFADGLVVTDHVVKVKVDTASEGFLTVGEAGVKLSGVQNAINAAVNAAVEALDVDDAAVAGQYVSAVSETDGKVSISRANVADAVLNGYAKGVKPASGKEAVAATDDVKGAIAKLEHQVDAAKAAATAAVEALDATVGSTTVEDGEHVAVQVVETDGKLTALTVTESDIASKKALDDEIAARKAVDGQTGQTYAANADTNYISGATSLNDADVKLDAELKKEADRAKAAEEAEVTRAQKAEKEIADKVGLTGVEGSRTFTPTHNYGGASATVMANMEAIDTKLQEVEVAAKAIQYQVSGTTLEFFGINPKA